MPTYYTLLERNENIWYTVFTSKKLAEVVKMQEEEELWEGTEDLLIIKSCGDIQTVNESKVGE